VLAYPDAIPVTIVGAFDYDLRGTFCYTFGDAYIM
jgi:hypothetical protein